MFLAIKIDLPLYLHEHKIWIQFKIDWSLGMPINNSISATPVLYVRGLFFASIVDFTAFRDKKNRIFHFWMYILYVYRRKSKQVCVVFLLLRFLPATGWNISVWQGQMNQYWNHFFSQIANERKFFSLVLFRFQLPIFGDLIAN